MKPRKRCYLCEQGKPTYARGKKHGLKMSWRMADFACPTTEDEYNEAIARVEETIASLKNGGDQ